MSYNNRIKVLIAHPNIPNFVRLQFEERGYLTEQCMKIPGPDMQELYEKLPGIHALIWWPNAGNPNRNLTKELFDIAGPNLRVVCTVSSGYDHIDIEEMNKRGILLCNMAKVQDAAVADMAVLLALATSRLLIQSYRHKNRCDWSYDPGWMLGRDLKGSTVGIIGLGNIGKAIVSRLSGFEVAKFLYTGRQRKPENETMGAIYVTFDELLNESDYVIVSCALTDQTRHIFDLKAFKKMKSTAIFINIARGEIVEQNSLVYALEHNLIWAAGIDVTTPEPLPPGHKLLSLSNCVVTPHKGSNTFGTREAMFRLAVENILLALDGKPMRTPVPL